MNKTQLQETLLQAIKDRVPNKTTLVNLLVDLLCIEKEAVYRRLRGEVSFTFVEIALIANELGISLDNIISSSLSSKSKPFQLKIVNYYDPTEVDYAMMDEYLHILIAGRDDPNSELFDCTNTLPPTFYGGYKYIERLHLLKSVYESGNTNNIKNFEEVKYSPRAEKFVREHIKETKQIKNSYFIFDPLVFQYLINDIFYFKSINLITDDDTAHLKEEFLQLLRDMEMLAATGIDKDSGQKVYMYIASINFEVSFWYVSINNYRISMLKVFVLNNFSSLDEDSFQIIKTRINAVLRSSTMISVSGERQRRLFFEKQREIINTL